MVDYRFDYLSKALPNTSCIHIIIHLLYYLYYKSWTLLFKENYEMWILLLLFYLFLQDISIVAFPTTRTVRENVGDVEICFMITQGSIEAGTNIEVSGNTVTRDGSAEGNNIYICRFTIWYRATCVCVESPTAGVAITAPFSAGKFFIILPELPVIITTQLYACLLEYETEEHGCFSALAKCIPFI